MQRPLLNKSNSNLSHSPINRRASALDVKDFDGGVAYGLLITKWVVPMVFNMLSLMVCSFCMHVATYKYVNQISKFEEQLNSSCAAPQWMSQGLEDPVEAFMQAKHIDADSFDHIATLVPLMWAILTFLTQDLHLWFKVTASTSLFALWKGTLALVTIVPDSSGWAGCKQKLQYAGIQYFTQEVSKDHVNLDILSMQFFGTHRDRLGPDVKYCIGSLYSSQSILFNFSCLYALGLFELVRRQSMLHRNQMGRRSRRIILGVLGFLLFCMQVAEIYLALLDRAYYSRDIVVSLVLSFLCYTNGPLQLAVKWWIRLGEENHLPSKYGPKMDGPWLTLPVAQQYLREEGDLFVPSCCVPFCLFDGYHHMVTLSNIVRTDRSMLSLPIEKTHSNARSESSVSSRDHQLEKLRVTEETLQYENQRLRKEIKELRNVLQIAMPTL